MPEIPAKFAPQGVEDPAKAARMHLPAVPQKRSLSRAFDNLGLTFIDKDSMRRLQEFGSDLDPATMMRASRTGAYVTQAGLLDIFGKLMKMAETADNKLMLKIAPVVATVAGKLNTANKEMADTSRKEQPPVQTVSQQQRTLVPLQNVSIRIEQKPDEKPLSVTVNEQAV